MATRTDILEAARKCVCGDREQDYGSPENSFLLIAQLWEAYMKVGCIGPGAVVCILPEDVAAMLALLKIARIATGHAKEDNWIDLAGYAACGGELQSHGNQEGPGMETEPCEPVVAEVHPGDRLEFECKGYPAWADFLQNGCVVGIVDVNNILRAFWGDSLTEALTECARLVDEHIEEVAETMNMPDHPVIRNMERTGYPDGKIPDTYLCPNCGSECKKYYTALGDEIVGCEHCIEIHDAEDLDDSEENYCE